MRNDFSPKTRLWAILLFLVFSVNACNSYETALWEAVEKQEVGNVERLLDSGADPLVVPEGESRSIIEIAAEKGNPRIVKMLLATGIDPNLAKGGEAPLWLAMKNGFEASAIELVNAGADVNGPEMEGFTPFYFAVMQDFMELATKMLAHKADVYSAGPAGSPAHEAAENGNLGILQLLEINGADLNRINEEGETPLFLALDAKKYETAEFLLKHQANPNISNALGNTVLASMVSKNDTAAMRMLCRFNADPNTQNLKGESPLHQAAAKGFLEAAKILVQDCYAKLNLRDFLGLSPAGLAFREGQTDLVDYLTSIGGRLR